MKIGIDLDGVIFDMTDIFKTAHELCNEKYFPPIDWSMNCYTETVREDIFDMFRDPSIMDYLSLLHSLKDLQDLFNKWVIKGHELFIVSSRYKEVQEVSSERVKKLFPMINEIHISEQPKIEMLKELNIDLHIDDSPNVIQSCIDNNIKCTMISNEDTPYNWYMRDLANHKENILLEELT